MNETTQECPFCRVPEPILRNRFAFAAFDLNPVAPGHLLLVTMRHASSFFDTTPDDKNALLDLLEEAKAYLDKVFHPDGYNIGVNVGEAAGQTIGHVHVHLIPRYRGDAENPRGGVRGVIPQKQSY